jgi:hypothetical protein
MPVADGLDRAVDEIGIQKWAHGIVDEHSLRRDSAEGDQAEPNGILPRWSASYDCDAVGVCAHRFPQQAAIVLVDDYGDRANAGMGTKDVKRVRDNGAAADFPVLLRSIALAGALASAGGDDNHGNLFICCHE